MIREAELEDMEKKWKADNERIMREHPLPPPDRNSDWGKAGSPEALAASRRRRAAQEARRRAAGRARRRSRPPPSPAPPDGRAIVSDLDRTAATSPRTSSIRARRRCSTI